MCYRINKDMELDEKNLRYRGLKTEKKKSLLKH